MKKDQGLVTLESDKASMEVPAPFAGIVRELKVKVGDEITAKVYDGDFRTLHDVQVLSAKQAEIKPAPAAKDSKKAAKAPAKK